MNKNKDKLVSALREQGYNVIQTEKTVLIKLPKYATVILKNAGSNQSIVIKFGYIKMEIAILLSILCYLLLLFLGSASINLFFLIPMILLSIYWNISRYKTSATVKEFIKSFTDKQV